MVREWDPILYCYVWRKKKVTPAPIWNTVEYFCQKAAFYSVGTALILGAAQLIATYGNQIF